MASSDLRDAANRGPEFGAVASRDRMPGYGELARVLLHSSEVAIHIGYTKRGWRGGLVTGLAFLAPTFVFVVTLSYLYFRYGTLPAVEGLFWGLKPVIVAIIPGAGWKLGRAAVTDGKLLALALGGVVAAVFLDRWEVAATVAGGVIGWIVYHRAVRPEQAPPGGADPTAVVPPAWASSAASSGSPSGTASGAWLTRPAPTGACSSALCSY